MSNINDASEVPSWPVQKCRSSSCEYNTPAYFCTRCINDHYAIKRRYDKALQYHKDTQQQHVVNEFLKKRDAQETDWEEVDAAVEKKARRVQQNQTPGSPEFVVSKTMPAPKKLVFKTPGSPVSVPVKVDPRIMKLPKEVLDEYNAHDVKADFIKAQKEKSDALEEKIQRLQKEIQEMKEDFI